MQLSRLVLLTVSIPVTSISCGQLQQAARAVNGETVIVTFDPHPREVLSPGDKKVRLLTTL